MKSKEAMELVDAGIKTLTDELAKGKSDNLKRFLSVAANFHNYSLNNWCLIFSQKPTASRVAGYKTWQKLGRQVQAGAKGIKILAPRRGKQKDKEGNATDKEYLFFTTTSVFDVSDTEGDELPSVFRVEGEPGEHLDALEALVESLGIKIEDKESLGGALGASYGGRIEMKEGLEPSQRFTTLVHELAHELLHKQKDRETLSKAVKETEAEAVSFVVGQAIGVDTLGQTADYVQLWKGDLDVFTASLGRIQKCAKQIIEGLQKSPVPA
jgi:hypothetical protein